MTGTSTGTIRLWTLDVQKLVSAMSPSKSSSGREPGATSIEPRSATKNAAQAIGGEISSEAVVDEGNIPGDIVSTKSASEQIGVLIGTYETGRRITCLTGFFMTTVGAGAKPLVNGNAVIDERADVRNLDGKAKEGEDWEGFDSVEDQ